MENQNSIIMHATTILCVKKGDQTIIGGDGQVSLGSTVMKSTAKKIRKIYNDKILTGFAGSTADAFSLFEKLESKLEQCHGNLMRSCVELAKDWRGDKYLRKLEAMMIVADAETLLILSGNGDVIEPEHNIAAIGSGGMFALSAARALIDVKGVDAKKIVEKSLNIAADICVYTNHNISILEL